MLNIALVVLLSSLAVDPRCVPSTPELEARLEAEYAPEREVWPDMRNLTELAWSEYIEPLHSLEESIALIVGFSAGGFPEIVLIRSGADGISERACSALEGRQLYRWPLAASQRFRMCGSINRTQLRYEFGLRVDLKQSAYCVGNQIPAHVTLSNDSGTSQNMLVMIDATVEDYLYVLIAQDGQSRPQQAIRRDYTPATRAEIDAVAPGWSIAGDVDLAQFELPDGNIIGQTPGEYNFIAEYTVSGIEGVWSGVTLSEPVRFTVSHCDSPQSTTGEPLSGAGLND